MKIKLEQIKGLDRRVRKQMSTEKLEELADSIKDMGVIVPIKVRKNGDGYTLVYGHRRVVAAKMVGLTEIEAIVEDVSEDELLTQSLAENVIREDMAAIDIAKALQQIIDDTGCTQEALGKRLGWGSDTVNRYLIMLQPEIRKVVEKPHQVNIGFRHVEEARAGTGDIKLAARVIDKAGDEGLSRSQTRQVADAIRIAEEHGDKARVKEILEKPYVKTAATLEDEPLRQEARAKIIERMGTAKPIAWEQVPEVAKLLRTIRAWKGVVPEFDVAINVGKFSPEAKRFAAEKIKELIREVRSFLKTLEELQKNLEA